MKIYRKILSLTLISAMLFSAFPAFHCEDASRDNKVDLKDAVMLVMDLAGSADDSSTFREGFVKALSGMEIAAGMKTVIQASDDTRQQFKTLSIDYTFLISSIISPTYKPFHRILGKSRIGYQSIVTGPSSPPPKAVHC